MKNSIKNLVIVCVAIFTLTSCNDFLTIEDPTSVNSTNFPASVEQCNLLLNTCYAGNHLAGLYAYHWFPMEMYLFDHTSDLFGSTFTDKRETSAANRTLADCFWTTITYVDIFKTVNYANTALAGVERYRESAPESEQARLNYIYGQALFFRALAYWHGQIFYEVDNVNGKGLPIFRKSPSTVEEMSAPRNKTGECYAFIIENLIRAAELLNAAKSVSDYDGTYRVNEWGAKGLLAKAYMQGATANDGNGYLTKAKDVMEDIFQNSGKQLVDFDTYKYMFSGTPYSQEFNSESLYEIDMIMNANQNGPWGHFTMGSGMPMVFAPTFVLLDVNMSMVTDPWQADGSYLFPTNEALTLESAWVNNGIHDANIRRFGFISDTMPLLQLNPAFNKELANILEIKKNLVTGGYDTIRTVTLDNLPYKVSDDDYTANSLALRATADPRLSVCAAQPWVDTAVDNKGRTTLYNRAGAVGGKDRTNILGWWHKKFTNLNGVEKAPTAGYTQYGKNLSSDANIPVVRLADIYLLYAECMQKLGNDATALEYVNKVHRRAYGYSADSPSPVDYTSLNAQTEAFKNDPTDILATDVIKYERWAELFAEGQWWYDVRRWKIGQNEVNVYKTVTLAETPLIFNGDDYYVQPIPQAELDKNKGMEQSGNY